MTPLVLVHGFLGGSAQWESLTPPVSAPRKIIAVDLPGFGANAHLPPLDRIGAMADWVLAGLRSRGVEHYDLLGHSMGGMVAQEIAARDPGGVQKLVLYATGATGVLPGRFETIETSKRRAREDGAKATARRISATWFLEQEAAPGYPACAALAELARLEAMEAGLDAMQAWSGEAQLAYLKSETLVLWGDRDRTYAWPQIHLLWTEIENSHLAVVPGCAHAVHAEKDDLFQALLWDFLS